jgi:hypothetical protein
VAKQAQITHIQTGAERAQGQSGQPHNQWLADAQQRAADRIARLTEQFKAENAGGR